MKSYVEFRQFYNDDLLPELTAFEDRRKGIIRNTGITAAVVAALAGIFLMIRFDYWIVAAIAGPIIVFVAFFAFRGNFAVDFKTSAISRMVKFMDPGLDYEIVGLVPEDLFVASRLFESRIDRYRGEDLVHGVVGKTEIAFSEIHAERREVTHDSKGRRRERWVTIFKGVYFVGDFNKHFNGITVVVPDFAEKFFGGWLGGMFQKMAAAVGRSGELIKLEDPEFEKAFAVYGEDQVEARYILSPALMRRLLDFKNKTGRGIFVSFAESSVFVAIPQARDMFEPRIMTSLLNIEMAQEFWDDLSMTVGIVEDLNLNTRIWTKE